MNPGEEIAAHDPASYLGIISVDVYIDLVAFSRGGGGCSWGEYMP